jgi:hypothetical protein
MLWVALATGRVDITCLSMTVINYKPMSTWHEGYRLLTATFPNRLSVGRAGFWHC